MNIELRNLKWSKAHSRETPCYVADVYIDGVKAGDVRNDGGGGQDMVSPPRLTDAIDAYAKTLPPLTRYGKTRSRGWTDVISDAFEKADARREFERRIGKQVMFRDRDGRLKIVSARRGATPADVKRSAEAWMADGRQVLQLLPAEEAFALYWQTIKPEGAL